MAGPSRVNSHSNLDQELASEVPEHGHPLNAPTPGHNVEPSSPFISNPPSAERLATPTLDQNDEYSSPFISNPPSAVRHATPVQSSQPSSPFISNPPSAVRHASLHQNDESLTSGPDEEVEESPTPQTAIDKSSESCPPWAIELQGKMMRKFGQMSANLKKLEDGYLANQTMLAQINRRLAHCNAKNAKMDRTIASLSEELLRQQARTIHAEEIVMKEVSGLKKTVLHGIDLMRTAKTELADSVVHLEAATKSSLGSMDASLMFCKVNVLREVKDSRAEGDLRGSLLQQIGSEVESLHAALEKIIPDRESSMSLLSQHTVERLDQSNLEASRSVEAEIADGEVLFSETDRQKFKRLASQLDFDSSGSEGRSGKRQTRRPSGHQEMS